MDPNENTSQEKKPGQAQSPELQVSANQADEPGNLKSELSRKCKICGGPNHYGCGCEAKAARESGQPESKIDTVDLPADETQTPAEKPQANPKTVGMVESEAPAALKQTQAERDEAFRELIEEIIRPDEIKKILEGQIDFIKNIKTMTECIETMCACFCDTNEHLKWLRESKDLKIVLSYLSKIDNNLEELLKEYQRFHKP